MTEKDPIAEIIHDLIQNVMIPLFDEQVKIFKEHEAQQSPEVQAEIRKTIEFYETYKKKYGY